MEKFKKCTDCNFRKCQEQCRKEHREFPNSIAKAVYEARTETGKSQAEFAAAIGIKGKSGQTIIAFLENGIKNRKPTSIQALRMSEVSGFPIQRFIVETDDTVLNGDIDTVDIAN